MRATCPNVQSPSPTGLRSLAFSWRTLAVLLQIDFLVSAMVPESGHAEWRWAGSEKCRTRAAQQSDPIKFEQEVCYLVVLTSKMIDREVMRLLLTSPLNRGTTPKRIGTGQNNRGNEATGTPAFGPSQKPRAGDELIVHAMINQAPFVLVRRPRWLANVAHVACGLPTPLSSNATIGLT
jgi:hypothetical protein